MNKNFIIDTSLYTLESITSGIQDFSEVAVIHFSGDTLSIQSESNEEIQEIFSEFMNYILSI